MIRRLVQLTVLSLIACIALVASVPAKRTATLRLELWLLAALTGILLVHLTRERLPAAADPLARPPKPDPLPDEPAAVESLATAFTLALSTQERVRRNAEIHLRDALTSSGAPDIATGELPKTLTEWSALLERLEAS
ncbi:MAG TPA: hypothetical protein VK461_05345 [Acidimicrobiales bacterium]|nr:hypothetical protein [Acidimicrobiales bacterium]